MLDISFIRDNVAAVKEAAANKNVHVDIDELVRIDDERRALQQELDAVRQQRNEAAAASGNKKPSATDIATGKELKVKMQHLEDKHGVVHKSFMALLMQVPNMPAQEVPIGPDDSANHVVRQVGEVPKFDFDPKPHWQLGEELGVINS
ncbi:hypothetical protein CL628_03035, partial [bacterium]|nr:hypothetical protein [bacterium]